MEINQIIKIIVPEEILNYFELMAVSFFEVLKIYSAKAGISFQRHFPWNNL
jgi:hypothetical protein